MLPTPYSALSRYTTTVVLALQLKSTIYDVNFMITTLKLLFNANFRSLVPQTSCTHVEYRACNNLLPPEKDTVKMRVGVYYEKNRTDQYTS